ncbi:MAG TPA: DUF4139 domain-containing protein [Kofleriaceae bacterium]|jgi:hypothetical protein
MATELSSVDARITHVTVYATGARIVRSVTIPAPLPPRVRIVGLPIGVIDDTVRVEVGGPAIATNVRMGVEAPAAAAAAPEETAEIRAATRRSQLADAEAERLTQAVNALTSAGVVEHDDSEEPPAAWATVVAARRALIALRAEREVALRDALVVATHEAEDARNALAAAHDREARGSNAQAAKLHELRKYVDVELVASASGELVLHVEYQVAAARWAPSYVARIDGTDVRLELRAVVAQDSGEDWLGVPVVLSTAEPARFSVLPELPAQRIGRRQSEPAKTGFRPAPQGAAALYADYERDAAPRRGGPGSGGFPGGGPTAGGYGAIRGSDEDEGELEAEASADFSEQVWDDGSSRSKERFATPPGGAFALPAPAPPPMTRMMAAPSVSAASSLGGGGMPKPQAVAKKAAPDMARRRSGSRAEPEMQAQSFGAQADMQSAEPGASIPRLDYGNLRMAGPDSSAKGTLVPAAQDPFGGAAKQRAVVALSRIQGLILPPGCIAQWAHNYDYAYATDGAIDVAADGAWHSIAVTAKPTTAQLRHVAVPREQADVFRVATFANPLAGPLLPGPIDVYDKGAFLVTSEIEMSPPGANVEIGLGVDATVKVARNTEFREEAAGMLRGALKLQHTIDIDVENLSARAIDLEVRERIPVNREGDDEVEVTIGRIDPAWERWTPDPNAPKDQRLRGGYRWRVQLAANSKKALKAAYEIKIASKNELVGGNRRES